MMNQIGRLIKVNAVFFTCFLLVLILSLYIELTHDKQSAFIFLNPLHNSLLDHTFVFFTILGNGWIMVIVSLVCFLFKKKKLSLLVLTSFLLSGLIAQVLKYFYPEARPAIFFEHSNYHYFITNITLNSSTSFPSGHTASAFAFAGVLAFYFRNKWLSLPLFLYACLVGYSRIYIGDHFLDDVIWGAVIGLASAMVCFLYLTGRKKRSP